MDQVQMPASHYHQAFALLPAVLGLRQ